MKSIDRLVAEHDIIERGLTVLEKVVTRIESGETVPAELTQWVAHHASSMRLGCRFSKQVNPRTPRSAWPVTGSPCSSRPDASRAT